MKIGLGIFLFILLAANSSKHGKVLFYGVDDDSSKNSFVKDTAAWKVDPKMVAIISYEKARSHFPGKLEESSLSTAELMLVDSLLKASIAAYHSDSTAKYLQLGNYKRQYVPAIDASGTKFVYVNCFCSGQVFKDWQKRLVEAKDGGKCFFHVRLNLARKEYLDFGVNGEA